MGSRRFIAVRDRREPGDNTDHAQVPGVPTTRSSGGRIALGRGGIASGHASTADRSEPNARCGPSARRSLPFRSQSTPEPGLYRVRGLRKWLDDEYAACRPLARRDRCLQPDPSARHLGQEPCRHRPHRPRRRSASLSVWLRQGDRIRRLTRAEIQIAALEKAMQAQLKNGSSDPDPLKISEVRGRRANRLYNFACLGRYLTR